MLGKREDRLSTQNLCSCQKRSGEIIRPGPTKTRRRICPLKQRCIQIDVVIMRARGIKGSPRVVVLINAKRVLNIHVGGG